MKAMILAAGLGTRLGELSKTSPKCLMEAGGKTLLEHVVDNLKKGGVTEIVINLHHLGSMIVDEVRNRGDFGINVKFSKENTLLGTGGGVLNARELLEPDEHFIIHNGDIFSDIDLRGLYRAHLEYAPLATLAVMDRPTSRHLLFNDSGHLVGWSNNDGSQSVEAPMNATKLAFSGIQVVSSSIFKYMESETPPFSTITAYLNGVRAGEVARSYRVDSSSWIDVGTPERLSELRFKLQKA